MLNGFHLFASRSMRLFLTEEKSKILSVAVGSLSPWTFSINSQLNVPAFASKPLRRSENAK